MMPPQLAPTCLRHQTPTPPTSHFTDTPPENKKISTNLPEKVLSFPNKTSNQPPTLDVRSVAKMAFGKLYTYPVSSFATNSSFT